MQTFDALQDTENDQANHAGPERFTLICKVHRSKLQRLLRGLNLGDSVPSVLGQSISSVGVHCTEKYEI